jgi:hypothetical protein
MTRACFHGWVSAAKMDVLFMVRRYCLRSDLLQIAGKQLREMYF